MAAEVLDVVAWDVGGNPQSFNRSDIMKAIQTFALVVISATFATASFARGGGMGGGMGGGQGSMAGQPSQQQYRQSAPTRDASGQTGALGTQTRTQTRDPASSTTDQPIQQRDRIHVPGTGTTTAVPATVN